MIAATGLRAAPAPSPAASVAAIDLKGVTKVYAGRDGGAVHALGPVDLRIEPGSFVSVVGPSGCGKSTLLRLVAGLEMPDQGSMQRYGAPLDGPSHEVGIVFQEHVLFPWISVLENVLLPADVLSLPKAASSARAMRLLEMTGLKDFANQRPQMLSGGMKQRAAFCRAMLSDPRLLLLDEPFGALDALTREELSLELSRLWQDLGRTALLITHDIEEAILLGDRILIMSDRPGTIRAEIAVDLPRPRNAETVKLPRFQEIKNQVRDIIFNRAQA
ncbi:ABC transporter ATP-binding protein [Bradyrhizobium roseum]|uniref:ABC transporter ATP-binding protein n=1 Tax=Bradyrhizobium roseum TaxID=3056648 RepID=UPI002635AC03|nr:ABC transporter ATP-binding protein [Bradyrhizobium roseus]WKA31351.1 ABC transporter ATP-binding protein [Bradyrhizobium roseus]